MYKLSEIMNNLDTYVDNLSSIYKLLEWKWHDGVPTRDEIKKLILRLLDGVTCEKNISSGTGGLTVTKEKKGKGWSFDISFNYDIRVLFEEDSDFEVAKE